MNRRALLALLSGAVLAQPEPAGAQQSDSVRRIGILMGSPDSPTGQQNIAALRDGLAKLGWVDGRNLQIYTRWGAGNLEGMRGYAVELTKLAPDVLVALGTAATQTLRENARGLPIVFVSLLDPVSGGFVKSLSHPGGNITGFTTVEFDLNGKWLELLKELAPQTKRISPIGNPDTIPYEGHVHALEGAAASLGIEVIAVPVHDNGELEAAINAAAREPGGGLVVLPDSFTATHRDLIIQRAARSRLPAIYPYSYFTRSGGLASYGVDQTSQFRQAASYIDRILRGTKPADLPVQQPTKFELVVNLKTANALGLTVPPSLLARADQVIE
jgi:putative ABC transport system substrate-binding protein